MGYFDVPRTTTLAEVTAELDVPTASLLNPVLFGRSDSDAERWIKRAVEAERW